MEASIYGAKAEDGLEEGNNANRKDNQFRSGHCEHTQSTTSPFLLPDNYRNSTRHQLRHR